VPAVLSISNVVIPGSVTLVLGVVAGMWPAEFAARLDPAVALTQEQ
jgi:ABC-type antimicrobial peptide transport system permease subunit